MDQRGAGGLPCRGEAEQQAGQKSGGGAERDDPFVEGEDHRRWQQTSRNDRGCDGENHRSHTKSQCSTKCREHEALGQDLHDDTAASGTERGAERQLTRASVRARQQQVGDVRTAHEQHEADHAEQ